MGLTISQLYTPTAFKYPEAISVSGQIAVNGSVEAPCILLTRQIVGPSPTWISNNSPSVLDLGYVGATWYKPGEGSFNIKYGENAGDWWANGVPLFGATTNKSTCFGKWGLAPNESWNTYGPDYFTGISPGNPPEYRGTQGVLSNVRINTVRLPEYNVIHAQDCVHIDSDQDGNDSNADSGTVSIGRNSYGVPLNLPQTVRIGWLALDRGTRDSKPLGAPAVVVGGSAARDLRGGKYRSAVFIGYECGANLKLTESESSDICLVNAGNFNNQTGGTELRNLVMFGTRAGVNTPTPTGAIWGDHLAIGDGGQVVTDKILSIGGNNIHNLNGKSSTAIIAAPDSRRSRDHCTTLGAGNAVLDDDGCIELSPGGDNGCYLWIGQEGQFRFKDNKKNDPGQILVSGGANGCPQWKTAVSIIEFRSDDGKTIRVTNGLITGIS